MADDQGWGDVAYQGHPDLKTPFLDKLASESLVFDRFYAAAPVCSPTRGSVMTGRHPIRFGCFSWGHSLRPQEQTIAHLMRAAGYRTGHFGKWHLGSVQSGSPVNPGTAGFDHWVSAPNFYDNDPILSQNGKAIQTAGESSMVTARFANDFIENCIEDNQKFFVVVWFGSPHNPHRGAPEDLEYYAGMDPDQAHFLAEITGMDRAIGSIREHLEQKKVWDDTLLWYCSDNGALPKVGSTGGFRGKKGSIYEGGLLVPSLISCPGAKKKALHVPGRVSTSDILPTLARLAGVSRLARHPSDGIALTSVIRGATFETRPVPMGFWNYPVGGIRTPSHAWMSDLLMSQSNGLEPQIPERIRLDAGVIAEKLTTDHFPGHAAWIDGNLKLHKLAPANPNGSITWELYDLKNDPSESENIIQSADPDMVSSMKAALKDWQLSVVNSHNGLDYEQIQK